MSPVDHPTRKLNSNLQKAVDALSKLEEVNVSYHLFVHVDGRSQIFGTPNCLKTFKKYEKEINKALVEDILDACKDTVDNGNQSEVIQNDSFNAKLNKLKHGDEFEKTPYPLSLMNRKEKLVYLRYLITFDRMKRIGSTERKIIAGDQTWKPRFWPDANIGLLKNSDLKGESPTSYSCSIPENYFKETTSKKMIQSRKINLGFHEPPAIVNKSKDENVASGSNAASGGDSNQTFTVDMEYSDENEDYAFPTGATVNDPPIPNEVHDHPIPNEEPTSRPHLEPLEDNGNPIFFELPGYLLGLAPAKKIQYNPGGGMCLTYAVAQAGKVDPKELKVFANEKMIEWWVHLKSFITFPLSVTVGSGNESYQKKIDHQYEFFTFLRSIESLYAYNTGEVEVVVLATIINQPIHLLEYHLQGFPPGTPVQDRCRIKTIEPINFLMKANKFLQPEDPFLLYEDNVHFSLLVDRCDDQQRSPSLNVTSENCPNLPQTETSPSAFSSTSAFPDTTEKETEKDNYRDFIDGLEASLFPGENEVSEDELIFVETTIRNHEVENPESERFNTDDVDVNTPKTSSKDSPKRKPSENLVGGIFKRTKIDQNLAPRRSKRIKTKQNTLDRLL